MKYDKEISDKLAQDYQNGVSVTDLAKALDVPERSVIAKLSSMGIYKKQAYLNKRGEIPVKKFEYIEKIADLLDADLELLESLEKVNKSVLIMLVQALEINTDPKP